MAHQFASRLRKLRSEWGLLQRELEEQIALRPGSVSQYERGLREPGFDLLMSIADELDVSLDFLLGRPFAPQASPVLLQAQDVLREALARVEAPVGADARLAFVLAQAGQVAPDLFSLKKLARFLTVSEATLKASFAGAGGLSSAAREKLARHLGVESEWLNDSGRI